MKLKILKKSEYPNGFTLAEVLITLVIIGIIAAMTIPTLINNTNKQELVTGLKKMNSTLQQALISMARNNDSSPGDYSFITDADFFIDELAKVVSLTKKCSATVPCFGTRLDGNGTYKRLNNLASQGSNDGVAVVFSDGQLLQFRMIGSSATNNGISQEDMDNVMGRFIVDVNGQKGPNVFGRDTFYFYLVKGKGIVPAGSENTNDCGITGNGASCAAKVLRENAMNY